MLMFASFYVEAELIAYLTDPETGEIYPDIFRKINIFLIKNSLLKKLFECYLIQ